MYPTKYHKPASVADAVAAMAAAGDGKFLSGGHSLLPTMKQHLAAPTDLVDVRGIDGMVGITLKDDMLVIGGATTHAAVATSAEVKAHIPVLAELAGSIGDAMVRHMGTIGGSLANNDPAADYPSSVLALGAVIVTSSRRIAAPDFFDGIFATTLEDDEIITAVEFPKPRRGGYAKFRNPASRYPVAGVMVAETSEGIRVAVIGAGNDGVFRHAGLEAALSDNLSPDAVDGVTVDPAHMLSDIHANAEYRANLVKVMAKRAVAAMV